MSKRECIMALGFIVVGIVIVHDVRKQETMKRREEIASLQARIENVVKQEEAKYKEEIASLHAQIGDLAKDAKLLEKAIRPLNELEGTETDEEAKAKASEVIMVRELTGGKDGKYFITTVKFHGRERKYSNFVRLNTLEALFFNALKLKWEKF